MNMQNIYEVYIRNKEVFSLVVGKTLSFADNETNKEKGTSHKHSIKYAITFKIN